MKENAGRPDWVFNLHDAAQGIPGQVAAGLSSRIFPGSNAMLSIVCVEPHSAGAIHQHPEEQWGVLLEGPASVSREARKRGWVPEVSGRLQAIRLTAYGPKASKH